MSMINNNTIDISVNVKDIGLNLDNESAKELILAIDAEQMDAQFTEDLVISLMTSLREDYTKEEYEMLIEQLASIGEVE